MRNVYIAGLGQTAVGEHWEVALRQLAHNAADQALRDAGGQQPQALFVGNMLAGQLSHQAHLGALIADYCGWRGIEAATVEAAGASGGAALRQAYLAVSSGLVDNALVIGVEKMTDKIGAGVNAALASAHDSDYEAAQGVTPTALAALLMRRYMHNYGVELPAFAGFSVNAHANAKSNPQAMYHNTVTAEAYAQAGMVADPVNLFDTAPDADGAAAVLLSAAPNGSWPAVRVAASAAATEPLALHDRREPLHLTAAGLSADKAYEMAGVAPEGIALFELHDAFGILAALSLEACGFAHSGEGWRLAADPHPAIARGGHIPISTFGGLKARGNPGGATGVYQAVELALQLRGEAGKNQVGANGAEVNGALPRWGMAQSLGGLGATAVTHIFERVE